MYGSHLKYYLLFWSLLYFGQEGGFLLLTQAAKAQTFLLMGFISVP